MLQPVVHVSDALPASRIDPGSPARWSRWHDSYRGFLLHYARLGASEAAEALVVGTDLPTAVAAAPGRWRELIAEVRREYRGLLLYSAGVGSAAAFPAWDTLDLVGVQVDVPLSESPGSAVEDLEAGARRLAAALADLARTTGRRVVLTELGFRSVAGPGEPGAPSAAPPGVDGRYDPDRQAAAFEAVRSALAGRPWFAGLFVWMGGSEPTEAGLTGFALRPPAQGVLQRWFDGTTRRGPGAAPLVSRRPGARDAGAAACSRWDSPRTRRCRSGPSTASDRTHARRAVRAP